MKLVAAVVGLVGLGATAGFASSSFTDVEQDRYYTDAVEWAFDNGVTTGTSAATFSPEDPATRAQSVTFLHRYDENVVQPALDDLTSDIAGLDTLDELSCTATQVVINDDGWRCASLRFTRSNQLPPGVTIRTLADFGQASDTSLVVGAENNPVIAYVDDSLDDLMLYVCDSSACASGTNRKLADVGRSLDTSLVIGADNNPVIAYVDVFNDDLMLYVCDEAACTSGTRRQIRNGGGNAVGNYTSVALGADGNPIIAHLDNFNGGSGTPSLDLYVCDDAACASRTNHKLVDVGGASDTSLVVGADNNPVIAYVDDSLNELMLYVCDDAACASGTNRKLADVDGVSDTSVMIGADNNPLIAYVDDSELGLYACADAGCTFGADHRLVETNGLGIAPAVSGNDFPVVTYFDNSSAELKFVSAVFGILDIAFE